MAAGDYSLTLMLDVFERLGRNELGEEFSQFQHKQKGNLETVRCISDNSALCYPDAALRAAFNEKVSPDQDVYIDVNQIVDPGVGTQSVRIGDGGNDTIAVQIVAQTPIQEGFQVSRVNESLRRFNNYSVDVRSELAMTYLTAQAMENIMVRLEKQAQAWLDLNKWAGGGDGSIFAALGDYKSIPAADDETVFQKINTEARENKIKNNNAPGFSVIGSDYTEFMFETTKSYGANNQSSVARSLENIKMYIASELEAPVPATQQAVLYTIAPGGVGMIGHAHKFADEEFSNGQDMWMTVAIPPLPMFDGIKTDLLQVQAKGFKGWADNFATYANDPSRIDIVEAMSFTLTPYFFRSYSPTARRPIVGYVKLK